MLLNGYYENKVKKYITKTNCVLSDMKIVLFQATNGLAIYKIDKKYTQTLAVVSTALN